MREPQEFEVPLCAQVGGDFWFPEREKGGTSQVDAQFAKSICRQCKHITECAEWGIQKETHGVWGGLSPRQRMAIRKQRRITLEEEKIA